MPTWGPVDAGAAVATTSSGLGAGLGPHCPVGTWSGTRYRSALRWALPSGFASWTSITKATLKVKTTDFAHVGPRNSTIKVQRMDIDTPWTKGSGTQDCNNGFSGSNNTQYGDLDPVGGSSVVTFQSGTAENSWKSIDVTAIVRIYFDNQPKPSVLCFVLDQQDSSDYAEFWSNDKSGSEPTLTIDYVDASPPAAPTLVAPAANAVNQSLTPTLSWTHDGTDGAQTGADIDMWETSAPSHLSLIHVTGAAGSTVIPAGKLHPGLQYQWQVRTSNSTGTGAYSGIRYFTTDPDLGVVITGTEITWAKGAPRIMLNWNAIDQLQYQIEKQDGTILVPWVGSPNHYHLLDALTIADNVAIPLRVRVMTAYSITDFADSIITPRFGLSSHHKVIAAPSDWLSATPTLVAPVPTGATIHMQYGSHPSSATAPLSWVDDIGQVPKGNTHFFWRVYLMPGQGNGPTLDKLVISTLGGAALDLDKWTTSATFPTTQRPVKPHAFAAPWAVDQSEYVYGSRSVSVDVAGAGPYLLWHEASIRLRAKRSYILTGLMKSSGNSGACFELQDATGTVLQAQGVGLPAGPMRSPVLTADTTFYGDLKDVHRYRTPVLTVGDADIDVYVALKAGGVAGAKAYFDAIKLEESTVATPWSPGSVGASIVDAGGVQIDGQKGGVFRYKGSLGGPRDTVEGYQKGLRFGGDTELNSPSVGILNVNGVPIGGGAAFVGAKVFNSGVQAVTQGIFRLNFDSDEYDTNGFHTPAGGQYLKVPVGLGGYYDVGFLVYGAPFQLNGYAELWINSVNTGKHAARAMAPLTGTAGSTGTGTMIGSFPMFLNDGDILEVRFNNQVASSTVNIGHASAQIVQTSFWLTRLDPVGVAHTNPLWGSGLAFPSNPVVNDRFYRTDLGMDFFWNGTRWLNTVVQAMPVWGQRLVFPVTANTSLNAQWPHPTLSIWVEALTGDFYALTPNDASNYWTYAMSDTSAVLSSQGLAINTFWHRSAPVNQLFLPTSTLQVSVSKVGSPGGTYPVVGITYRLVGP